VFNQADPDDKFTTLSLYEDPEPAAQRARARARELESGKVFWWLCSGIGLAVVIAIMYGDYIDYLAHKQELSGLIARGRRIPAQLSGEPVRDGGRYSYVGASWRVEYAYTVDGRAYKGSAHMHARPASITVVIDPWNPAAHRADGSLEPSNMDGQRLLALGALAAGFGLAFLFAGPLEWLNRRRE